MRKDIELKTTVMTKYQAECLIELFENENNIHPIQGEELIDVIDTLKRLVR